MQGNLSSSAQAYYRQMEALRTPDLIGDAPSFGATPFEPTSFVDASGASGGDTDDAKAVRKPFLGELVNVGGLAERDRGALPR